MDPTQAVFLIGLCYVLCCMIFGEGAFVITTIATALACVVHHLLTTNTHLM